MEHEADDPTIVAVAVNDSNNSQYAVKWALKKFIPIGINLIKLIYVRPETTPNDRADASNKDVEWKPASTVLLPYMQMCLNRQVEAESHVIEGDDIAAAISEEITKCAINKLIIGCSSQSALSRKFEGSKSSKIAEMAPSFCTVYTISKGKAPLVRPSASYTKESIGNDTSVCSSISSCESSVHSEITSRESFSPKMSNYPDSLTNQHIRELASFNSDFTDTTSNTEATIYHSGNLISNFEESSRYSNSSSGSEYLTVDFDGVSSYENFGISISDNEADDLELLGVKLKHLRGTCEKTQNEVFEALNKIDELRALCTEDNRKIKQLYIQEEKIGDLVEKERKACDIAKKNLNQMRDFIESEKLKGKDAWDRVKHEVEEKQNIERALKSCQQHDYKKLEWEEIISATSGLSESLLIGIGKNGKVYKGRLHQTTVAIKVLQMNEIHRTKKIQQELEILARIHHPHLLLLVAACPEHGCLVYEYMENGNLSDRLNCKNNAMPLEWFHRYRIAWEIASALVFLHNSKPKPIVHRDLKPANILLDRNLVAKIGDVGLSTLLPADLSSSTVFKNTAPVGTWFYIDPEYQRTGMVSPKSDIYSFGVVILQLLTAKSPRGLPSMVEKAISDGCLEDVLDSKAGKWPGAETEELARMALGCLELTSIDRPDLQTEIVPLLEKLKKVADTALSAQLSVHDSITPNHFICPILKKVMEEPYVASDGYTYDLKAIKEWFSMNDKSPVTNQDLPNKQIIPNLSIHHAIKDWMLESDR